MVLLHASLSGYEFLLWGEQPLRTNERHVKRRKRSSKMIRSAVYPFGAPQQELLTAFPVSGFTISTKHVRPKPMTLWLPTVDALPLPSSPIIADRPEGSGTTSLVPWEVPTLHVSVGDTVDLLAICLGKQTLAPGVIIGRDLAFWAKALQFSGSLVARQQFLPGLIQHQGTFHARWEPVIGGTDADQFAQLVKGMPPVARALSQETHSPPEVPASTLLSRFIAWIVDSLIRPSFANTTSSYQRKLPARLVPSANKSALGFNSLHERWLQALRASDGVMEGEEAELAQLAEQIRDWRRPVTSFVHAPFRLCFRLETPDNHEGNDGELENQKPSHHHDDQELSSHVSADDVLSASLEASWYVRYLLQAMDDPSLLIPIQDAWSSAGPMNSLLKRRASNVQEYLLSALGQAANISGEIERSLQGSLPSGFELNTTGAHEFLTDKAMVLEQAGFGVMLPAWWTRKGTKLRLTTHAKVRSPKMQGGGGLSLEDIVQFDWEVALGDDKLSLQELHMLAQLKAPLVKIRGQWVEMNHEEIQAAIRIWEKKTAGSATVREVVRMALGATSTVGGIEFGGVRATGWIGEFLSKLEGQTPFQELSVSKRFHGTLRPYQVRGYSWLSFLQRWGLGACLADDMGLGKTPQTLALIQTAWQERTSTHKRPTLVICPTSVVNNWQKEAATFTPDLPVLVHHGLSRTKGSAFKKAVKKQAIVVSSYALLYRDFDHFKEVNWGGIVLDEAQNVKNPETLQAKAARSLRAEARIALTGTPVENNVGDLWSIMEFLNPGYLGTRAEFKRRFFIPIHAQHDPGASAQLKRLTGPFVLRRLKTDRSIIADLPEKQEMKVFCSLTKEQASLYTAVIKDSENALTKSEGIKRKGVVLATISKLKQICNHPAQFLDDRSTLSGRSGKLSRLTEMLEEMLTVGDRALIFSQFSEMGALLKRHLQETFGREVLFLHGGVPKKQRDQMVSRFQADGGDGVASGHKAARANGDHPSIFILSLKAGGTGLNLTRANHVFHFDRWWNPAIENQATDRAFRIGQTKNVQVHKYLCAGTLEEKIDEMIERKKEVAEQVVGIGEGWLTELSNEQLKELFALRAEAVEA